MASISSSKQREKPSSSFAVTCNLLSQFIKEKGRSFGDLGLDINGKSDLCLVPTTMSLLPGVDLSGEDKTEQREPEKSQLTIFYGGKVLVFNSFPSDKARDLMMLAGKGNVAATNNTGTTPRSSVRPASAVGPKTSSSSQNCHFVSGPSNPAPTVQCCPSRPSASDLPIARKASLHRFLEKRKDRINAKAPYQVNEVKNSPAALDSPKEEENQPWLGLKPGMSTQRS